MSGYIGDGFVQSTSSGLAVLARSLLAGGCAALARGLFRETPTGLAREKGLGFDVSAQPNGMRATSVFTKVRCSLFNSLD